MQFTTSDPAHLRALLGLISSSLEEVISGYHAAGRGIPPLESVQPGLFDLPEETPLHLTKAVQVIEGACAQLCASIAPPGHTVVNVCTFSN
jgi:hypothetical protein